MRLKLSNNSLVVFVLLQKKFKCFTKYLLELLGDKNAIPHYCFIIFFLNITNSSLAQQKDQRAGDCEQTKSQFDYFCSKKGDPAKDDIMTTANIACGNAKRNMAAACEGVVEKDSAYTFDNDGKPSKSQ